MNYSETKHQPRRRSGLFRLILLTLISVSLMPAANAGEQAAQTKSVVPVSKVTEAANTKMRRYSGIVLSPSSVNLTSRVSAELLKVHFNEGELVKEGDVLYTFDNTKYIAAVKNAKATVAQYKAKLEYAKVTYERDSRLFDNKVVAKTTVDSSLSEKEAYQAQIDAAEAEVASAQKDLNDCTIIAPITGRISVTNFTKGNYITPSSGTLATIVQMDPLRVRFSMSNRDFLTVFGTEKKLKEQAKISIYLANGKQYSYKKDGKDETTGVVAFINNEANNTTDSIQVYVNFPNPEGTLIPKSIVTVAVGKKDPAKYTAIKPTAILHDSSSAYVYVVGDGDKVERRDVILGNDIGNLQLVTKGLKLGETVVTGGTNKILPGSEIIPVME